jgi:prepilin-type N-terminal cleavage/methylation domain-containing protein
MRTRFLKFPKTCISGRAFTLIELLIVIAIISLLMAILMPAINKIRISAKKLFCQNNLRQITIAWDRFLSDNNESFLQGVNTNHDFGGWVGYGGFALERPLNPYFDLPSEIETDDVAEVFRCPSDKGGIFGLPPDELAYDYFGNSYQTNIFLVGPDRVGVPYDDRKELHDEINKRLKGLKRVNVSNSAYLVLVGDNNWLQEWEPLMPESIVWHGKEEYHNIAFLDCHVDFIEIRKGLYVTDEYSILPFKSLYNLAREVQEEVTDE